MGYLYFVFRGDGDSIRYIPVASSVNCAVPNISGCVWNWSVVTEQADASKILPFPCTVLVEVVEVLLVWQHKVVS